MPDIFTLKNIEYSYIKEKPALTNINLSVNEGEILSVIGSNGSGKSTLLHLLCGLFFPSKGTIEYKGKPFNEASFKQPEFNRQFRSSIGYVFQNTEIQLFCPTVMDELLFGPLQMGLTKTQAMDRVNEISEMLSITDLMERPGYMLSGGEKKRVAIGSILTTNPNILILDEPMSGLDPKTRAFIIELIFTLNKAGKTIIIATHHLELVNHLESRIVVLSEKNTIDKSGPCIEILSDTELLMRNNLVGEYPHMHEGRVHKHLQTGFFGHQHKQ
jgi:cobalt/nickel transport system ATP-binding protein